AGGDPDGGQPMSALAAPVGQIEIRERSGEGCVQANDLFCFEWAADNIERYVEPTIQQAGLVVASVVAGFAIAFCLAVLAHRRRWLRAPFLGFSGVLYTIPSLAFFLLLLPITGRGSLTAIIALTAYTLQIIYRNTMAGLANVPAGAIEAGRGMGLTERQILWQVELPLAVPEIVGGLRVATVSTVALATLAVFAGAGGLGAQIFLAITFTTNIVIAGGFAVGMALLFDLVLLAAQRWLTPWTRAVSA
ncbi:MAG TPA: ABC transporter permease, partial [Solirubrobacterales bacterium]|nr:ABC transporter permease [Solirubrobacterales bacterium]